MRKQHSIRTNKIESYLGRNHGIIGIPMAAFGEAICKVRDKRKDGSLEVFSELIRLLDAGVITPFYIKDGYNTYDVARKVAEPGWDARDNISPMDALIVASAIAEPSCTLLVTSDQTLTFNSKVSRIAREYREQRGYSPFKIKDVDVILKR